MKLFMLPLVLATALTLDACSSDTDAGPPAVQEEAALAEAARLAVPAADAPAAAPVETVADSTLPTVTVYKSPTCGCCSGWVEHMREEGFPVEAVDVTDISAVKEEYGIPPSLQSCHTAVVDGYLVEGHVPASDVKRLLAERPDAGGLALPGMPIGSPGMEVPGRPAESYEVLLVDNGETSVFAQH